MTGPDALLDSRTPPSSKEFFSGGVPSELGCYQILVSVHHALGIALPPDRAKWLRMDLLRRPPTDTTP